jgi:SAM-dependent methyltransferase
MLAAYNKLMTTFRGTWGTIEMVRVLGDFLNNQLLSRFNIRLVRQSTLKQLLEENYRLQQSLEKPETQMSTAFEQRVATVENSIFLIYTWGKVGSQAIQWVLSQSNLGHRYFRTHLLSLSNIHKELRKWRSQEPKLNLVTESAREQIAAALLLREKLLKHAKSGGVIFTISGVRELVGHALSSIFQTLAAENVEWERDFFSHPVMMMRSLRQRVLDFVGVDTFMTWFDSEFNALTGFDTRRIAFDHERGWGTATSNGFEIFVFVQEKLGIETFSAMSNWIGTPLVQPIARNVGVSKPTGALYSLAKEALRFTCGELDIIYASESSLLFYADKDRKAHRALWEGDMNTVSDATLIGRYNQLKLAQEVPSDPASTGADWERSVSWRKIIFEILATYTEELRRGPVLHAGCKTGEWTCWLHRLGARAIDASDLDFSDAFGVIASAFGVSATYREGDKTEGFVPNPPRYYALICAIGVLDSLMDPLHALAAYRKCLSKGGVLVLELRAREEGSLDQGEDSTRNLPVFVKVLEDLGMVVESSRFFADSHGSVRGRALISARVLLP